MTEWMRPNELISQLQLGDLVEFRRDTSLTYYHWGVYIDVEDGIKMIAHFSTEHGDFGENENTKVELSGKLLHGSSAHVRADPYVTVAGNSDKVRINNYLDIRYNPFPRKSNLFEFFMKI